MSKTSERRLLHSPIAKTQVFGRAAKTRYRMRSSVFSGLILLLYRLVNGRRRWRLGRLLIHLSIRLEGGAMWSVTAREIMGKFHGVKIGDYSYGSCFDPATVPPCVQIGRYVSIAPGVRLIVQNHPLDSFSTHPIFYEATPGVSESADLPPGELKIGNDVWIGCNAVVTPGCRRIGNGAVIGAGAIVTHDVPDFAIMAGNPAREIRRRFDDSRCAQLNVDPWWNRDPADILSSPKAEVGDAKSTIAPESEGPGAIASVIIPACNEEAVIGRCLRALLQDASPGELEIVVVGNGCTDATCEFARGFGASVRVIETSKASKVAALNLGDESASHFPRFYVDADVELTVQAIRESCQTLGRKGILAAAPRIAWDLQQCSRWVRAFYRVWRLQPYFDNGRLGSGVYAVNKEGHERLVRFPDVTADDEYVRGLFCEKERATEFSNCFIVTPPKHLTQLLKIKTRSRRGNRQLREQGLKSKRSFSSTYLSFLARLLARPQLWMDVPVYLGVVAATSWMADRTMSQSHATLWEKDMSSRDSTV